MRLFFLCTGLLGCATAGKDGPNDGIGAPDAGEPTATLSQTADTELVAGRSLACDGANAAGAAWTYENSWYRVFPLAAAGVTGPLRVSEVTFGVQEAGAAAVTLQLALGTYAGTAGAALDTALITPLTSAAVTVPPSATPQLITAPVAATVPAGSQLVVEIAAPNYQGQDQRFYAGASAGGESAPAYLRAPACGVAQPQSIKSLESRAGAVVITVTGTRD